VGDNADSHELLSVVTAVHHQGVGETLDDRALCLPEALCGITASGVGDVDWGADLDVVAGELHVSRRSYDFFYPFGRQSSRVPQCSISS